MILTRSKTTTINKNKYDNINKFRKTTIVATSKNSLTQSQKRSFVLDSSIIMNFTGLAVVASVSAVGLMAYRYKVSKPNEYLVRTGFGIKDIEVSKQAFQWPFQTFKFITVEPKNYSFELHAMSCEKIDFKLPGVFTIGPKDTMEENGSHDALIKYVRLVENSNLNDIILGILEGEVRTLSSQMTIEQIFNDRQAFKEKIIKNVQDELNQIGLYIYNANIKELQDSKESRYFETTRKMKISEAENTAKVEVSEQTKKGNIGAKQRDAETRQQIAEYESKTVQQENIKRQEIEKSIAELEIVKIEAHRRKELAQIEASGMTKIRDAELQKEIEQKMLMTETERLRASDLSKAQVNYETAVKHAEATASALKIESDATLYAKEQEAKGIYAVYDAQSKGINQLMQLFGNDKDALLKYLIMDKGIYEKLAKANADAIQGLNPKITVWNTSSDTQNPISSLMKNLPPLLTTIHDQTGLKPGDWLVKNDKI